MKHRFQTQPHPFRPIQITEWILLGIAVLSELPWENLPYLSTLLGESLAEIEPVPFAWLWTLLCLLFLGLLGLRLPTGSTLSKWIYIAIQFALILIATTLGNWISPFSMPYLVVAIRGYLIFRSSGRWWVTGLAFGLATTSLIVPLSDIQGIHSDLAKLPTLSLPQLRTIMLFVGISGILLCGLMLTFGLMLVDAVLSERRSRQQLAAAHQQLRRYALRIEDQATLQERNRIAREIHDAVGHNLTALRIQLENALLFSQSDRQKTEHYLQSAQQLAATALTEIRHSVSTLRSDPLQGKSLLLALKELCCEFQGQISGDLVYELEIVAPLKKEVSATVYRLVQEALTNVARHSQAKQIKLQIQTNLDYLWLMVEDNGIGFDLTQTTAGVGIKSMQERATAIGGQLYIVTAPSQGCQLSAKLPLTEVML
ncbi:MAG: sensor histidine kinase [Leptolyngbya sp. SIO1D8]|nr:sensor histidine kinase [Leptolyngbya sp. SIO1D8]